MDGLDERLYLRIPRHVQDAFGEFYPDEIRVIWNDKLEHPTVVIRNEEFSARWHDCYLRGWIPVCHWDQPLGDGSAIADLLRKMERTIDHDNDPVKTEEAIQKKVEEAAVAAQKRDDDEAAEMVDDHFNQSDEAIEAFDRDCAEKERHEIDNTKRHSAHTKISIAAGVSGAVAIENVEL